MLQKRIKKLKIVVDKQDNRYYINFNETVFTHTLYAVVHNSKPNSPMS